MPDPDAPLVGGELYTWNPQVRWCPSCMDGGLGQSCWLCGSETVPGREPKSFPIREEVRSA